MPVVTQNRVLKQTVAGITRKSGVTTPLCWLAGNGFQTTTSFRTGRGTDVNYDNLDGPSLRKEAQYEGQRSSSWDNGNEFSTESWSYAGQIPFAARRGADSYEGSLTMSVPGAYTPTLALLTSSARNVLGARAVADTIPSKPHAELATFLGELREGLPALPLLTMFRKPGMNSAGSEHLNMEFGLKPMISDIRKMCEAVGRTRKLFSEWERNSGRQVRRRRTLVKEESVTTLSDVSCNMGLATALSTDLFYFSDCGSSLSFTRRLVTSRKAWFAGAYSYYAAAPDGFLGKLADYEQKANLLLGTRFSVDDLWELTRWSWLIDWFADVGDVLTNAELLSSDSMVMRYGYLCIHDRAEWRLVATRPVRPLTSGALVVPSMVTHRERKARYRATPYGFGVSLTSLSGRRWAILGALGMTKAPDSLRLRS